jgi:hypothetical protein
MSLLNLQFNGSRFLPILLLYTTAAVRNSGIPAPLEQDILIYCDKIQEG